MCVVCVYLDCCACVAGPSLPPSLPPSQTQARQLGLWNLFLPVEADLKGEYGAELTNLEYAHLCEIMGQSLFASEVRLLYCHAHFWQEHTPYNALVCLFSVVYT